MIYMDRKTTTFIILLGLIIASSLFQGCIEGNTSPVATLKRQKEGEEKVLSSLYAEKNAAHPAANAQCKDVDCATDKDAATTFTLAQNALIKQSETKIEDLEEAIKMLETVEAENEGLREQIEEQKKEIRDAQNSAQGASIVLGKIQPDLVAQREAQNYTKQKLATAIKKIDKLTG